MVRKTLAVLVQFIVFSLAAQAGMTITPTTTLTLETKNNTSTADSFKGQTNGNVAAGNVSKVPIRELLYQGATTKIYVHFMPWFGPSNHVSVGYDSSNTDQARRQVEDMVSRGIDGAIIDWYGPDSVHHDKASLEILKYAEAHPGFEVALTEDWGAVNESTNPTQKTIDDLNYAWKAFMQSPAYMKRDGRPVVFFFGFELLNVDLAAVKAALPWNPLFIFRNSVGYDYAGSDGAFGWLVPLTSGYESYQSIPYLTNFYSSSLRHSAQLTFGSAFKGFDDTVASWGQNRHIQQYCGQTWINSFAEASRFYSSTKQLPALQIVTWNDYEEGSAIESGIDNCVSVDAWTSSSLLNWSIRGGQENTIHHFTVFVSTNGTDLMQIAELPASTRTLDLATYGLEPGTYQLFVKAVGMPSITNKMSSAASYTSGSSTIGGSTGGGSSEAAADWKFSLAPAAVSLKSGSSATMSIKIDPLNGAYNSEIAFSCSNLPAGMQCQFTPASVVPGANSASTSVRIVSSGTTTTADSQRRLMWMMSPVFGLVVGGLSFVRRKSVRYACVLVLIAMAVGMVGCGGGGASSSAGTGSTSSGQQTTYTISVNATSAGVTRNVSATVTVN